MYNRTNIGFVVLISILLIGSCSRKEVDVLPEGNFVFSSLILEKDTIKMGESTKIKAIVIGSKPEYHWSASSGQILGSGSEVIFVTACSCDIGKNVVTCTVTSGNGQSETKSVTINVHE